MRYQSFTKLAVAALAAAAFVAAPAAVQAKKMKVGFVYVGPIGDHGWTYQHHQGLLAVKKAYGDKVETTHVENVPEGPDAERVTRQLAQQGHDIIFTTSFGFMNPTIKVAKQFPKVKFEHSTGFKRSKNVATYNIRFYEARYVNGVIAGKMTKSNTIGYIASFPIPEVVRGINAAYLGAKSVNPKVKFKIVWVSTWFDPGKEADAAKALADQGADVIFQHTDSPAAMKLAEQRGISANRPGFEHEGLRAKGPAVRRSQQLGDLLCRACQGGDGWHLEIDRHMGRPRGRHAENRQRSRAYSGRCEEDGREGRGRHRQRQVPSLHRTVEQAGRQAVPESR